MPGRGWIERPGRALAVLGLVLVTAGACAGAFVKATDIPSARAPAPMPSAAAPASSRRAPAPGPRERSASGPSGPALPDPPPPDSNNLFGLVRPSADLASEDDRPVSPDGRRIAFVKTQAGRPGLFVAKADGSDARQVLDLASAKASGLPSVKPRPLAETSGMSNLAFSPDGKKIYFLSDGWATSLALYVVEIDRGLVRFVHDANGYQVIESCRDASQIGRLIILEHRYFDPLPGSAVDWYFLIDDRAKRFGIVGPEPENVKRFLAKTCGVGTAPADPPREKLPPALVPAKSACGEYWLSRKPIDFLDGTRFELFLARQKQHPRWVPMAMSAENARSFVEVQCPGR